MKGKEFCKRTRGKLRISLPRHHLVYHRRPYLHYSMAQAHGSAAEHRLRGSLSLETTPRSGTQEDTGRFTHPTSRGEWGPWSSVEIRKKSALSGATQREVLRCQVSNSLREGPRPQAQTHSTQRNHSRKFHIRTPVLENMISVLQQLTCSRSLGSQNPGRTAAQAHSRRLSSAPPTTGLSN